MKSLILKISIFFVVFFLLVFYNYYQAQTSLKRTKPSVIEISMQNNPSTAKLNTPSTFTWTIIAPKDFQASSTTIFYDYVSTPSSLTKTDSPSAVGYHFHSSDYSSGNFFLPNTFSSSLTFLKVGRVWYRGYANIRGNHLWTEEKYLDITK